MSAPALHVIILAAGEGKRMRSDLPKVLLPIAAKPMLAHVIEVARALNPAKVHIVYGHRGDAVRSAFPDRELSWVLQSEQRGTGHAVGLALAQIEPSARVLVLYGDVPLISAASLTPLVHAHPQLAVLSAFVKNPHGYGRVVIDDQARVERIVEERDASAAEREIRTINTGVISANAGDLQRWLAAVQPTNIQGEIYLTDVFALAANESAPAVVVTCVDPMEASGANDAWQLAELERRYQRRRVRALCEAGLRVCDPDRLDIRGDITHGRDVSVDVGVIFEGRVVLGDGVSIGAYTRVANCDLAAGTKVLSHCDLDGTVTEGACRIGPFARLRPGTRLGPDVHIGNFVETKQAQFATGAKANHLSYIGDADVGARSNIGAGTIFCNYDGVNKSRTTVGHDVFVGSNSSLVAPVSLGDGATLGAGSVISKNAPAGQLTIARARQTVIKGWVRPHKKPV